MTAVGLAPSSPVVHCLFDGRDPGQEAAHPGGCREVRCILRLLGGAQARGRQGRPRVHHRRRICHAYTPDGRCVSLLKILLTNWCLFDCAYCINRRSSNVRRAKFTVEEVVNLTLNFYRRNYIEGLFLSSGIIKSPDHTMELLTRVAKSLRRDHGFAGYIHLKSIPEASPWLIEEAGLYADRLSINVELPTEASLERLAPEKDGAAIQGAMAQIGERIVQAKAEKRRFSPAGHSTQVIVGADATTDEALIRKSALLYGSVGLKRVYYSAFSPIPDGSAILPPKPPPLQREHRLYQADWLLRYYEFTPDEVADASEGGMLALDIDPKLAWALKHREKFPGGREQGRPGMASAGAGARRPGGGQDHHRRAATRPCASTTSRGSPRG